MALVNAEDNDAPEWGTFTAVTSDKVFTLDIGTYITRSTFFAKALAGFSLANPPQGFPGIEVPDIDHKTFKYYMGCVEEGDANIPYASHAAENANDEEAETAADELHHCIMMQYCKGYFLATKLGDREAGILIIEALIDYSVETNSVLGNKHTKFIVETLSSGSGLYKLAVDMWAFAAEYAKIQESSTLVFVPGRFLADVLLTKMKAEAEGAGKVVEDVFDYGFISEAGEKYHCFDESDVQAEEFDDEDITWATDDEDEGMML